MAPEPLECVVLIDDESFDNKFHTRMIGKTGLASRVECFPMAEEALEWFRATGTGGVDLVLLDINMPRVNGFDFLERARDEFGPDFGGVTVVMVTTSIDPRDQDRAREFQMVKDFVQKPLLAEKFVELCAEIQGASALP